MASSKYIWRAQEPVTLTCSLCNSDGKVNWYCNDCQEALCDRCKEVHSRGKKTRDDNIVSIGKTDLQADKSVPKVCKGHPGKPRDLFCSDCEEVLCSVCVSEKHKQHNWKHLDQIIPTLKEHLKEHMTTIAKKVGLFKTEMSHLERDHKISTNIIETSRNEVNSQRQKLIAEVNHVADAVLDELSALEKEQLVRYKEDCQQYQTKVMKMTRLQEKAEVAYTSRSVESMLETERSLRTTLPRHNINVKNGVRKYPTFLTGCINRDLVRKMLGKLHMCVKKTINSKHVQQLSKFTVTQNGTIFNICPVDDSHAWLSIHKHKGLVLINKNGEVRNTVTLDFCPHSLAMMGKTDILMTNTIATAFVYKISLHNKQVTTFAEICPRKVFDISTNQKGEVFVSTGTPEIVVLNHSGTVIREIKCDGDGCYIDCLSSGIAVSTGTRGPIPNKLFIMDETNTSIQTWSGELDNGRMALLMELFSISYDRLFIPDHSNNQVYVLPSTGTRATCLLDRKHGVVDPTVVGVDTIGDVWIGCWGGTVHIMQL